MSTLVRTDGSGSRLLWPSSLVGRSRRADVRLDNAVVSGEHSVLRWSGNAWEIRDLGSRNGTWVNGQRLGAGETRALRARDELAFGDQADGWLLGAEDAPRLSAQRASDGAIAFADADVLTLPTSDHPSLVVSSGSDGAWSAERVATGEEIAVEDRTSLDVDGEKWRLCLPEEVFGATITLDDVPPALANATLRFTVRAAEEHVAISALIGTKEYPLGDYNSYYLLLYLARARQEDARDGALSVDDRGWRYQDEVLRALKLDANALYVEAHRARSYFARGGILGSRTLIERRRTTQQMRLGVERILIDRA